MTRTLHDVHCSPSFEASTVTHTEEENKACSTFNSLLRKASKDEREENRRTEEIKRGKREGKKKKEGVRAREVRGHLCALPPCITKQPMMDE